MRQPLSEHGYGGSSLVFVWVQLYTSVEFFESLKSPRMEPLVALTSRPIVAMMITLGYEMNYNVDQFNYATYHNLS